VPFHGDFQVMTPLPLAFNGQGQAASPSKQSTVSADDRNFNTGRRITQMRQDSLAGGTGNGIGQRAALIGVCHLRYLQHRICRRNA
jgi:hypothetical protein